MALIEAEATAAASQSEAELAQNTLLVEAAQADLKAKNEAVVQAQADLSAAKQTTRDLVASIIPDGNSDISADDLVGLTNLGLSANDLKEIMGSIDNADDLVAGAISATQNKVSRIQDTAESLSSRARTQLLTMVTSKRPKLRGYSMDDIAEYIKQVRAYNQKFNKNMSDFVVNKALAGKLDSRLLDSLDEQKRLEYLQNLTPEDVEEAKEAEEGEEA
ncbi:hypothetical protein SDC9_180364 [bioreactor metagenome]|uniref:Uncharacterized protein n=1 Tax=bioreactor metagenome TaxID=1076179 RepID=A0A645H1J5_9ZZZZ